jgi:hypothetical protein
MNEKFFLLVNRVYISLDAHYVVREKLNFSLSLFLSFFLPSSAHERKKKEPTENTNKLIISIIF